MSSNRTAEARVLVNECKQGTLGKETKDTNFTGAIEYVCVLITARPSVPANSFSPHTSL